MITIHASSLVTVKGGDSKFKRALRAAFTVANPEYIKRKRSKQQVFGVERTCVFYFENDGSIILPRNSLKKVLEVVDLHKESITYEKDLCNGKAANFGTLNSKFTLRSEQLKSLEKLTCDGILVAGAGSGKTVIGLAYASMRGRMTLWVTHTQDLMLQSKKRAEEMFPAIGKIGVFGANVADYGDGNLIVATFQTLSARPDLLDQLKELIGTVIIDEVHHAPAPFFMEVIAKFKAVNMLGLTATPQRKDEMEQLMYISVGPVLHTIDRKVQYEEGKLIKPTVKFKFLDTMMSQLYEDQTAISAGGEDIDYQDLMGRLLSVKKRISVIGDSIINAHGKNQYQIVISDYVKYAYDLKEYVEKAATLKGINIRTAIVHGPVPRHKEITVKSRVKAEAMVNSGEAVSYKQSSVGRYKVKVLSYSEEFLEKCKMPKAKRQAVLQQCYCKNIDILFATRIAKEGLDLPHLTTGHLATPKRGDTSKHRTDGSSVEQEIGRIMRKDPNNPDKAPVWYDYVDSNIAIFDSQYNSRKLVYRRLGINIPRNVKKKSNDMAYIEKILNDPKFF